MRDSNIRSEPTAPDRAGTVADAVLDTVPAVMRAIRSQMRASRSPGVSIPQLRVLLYVRRHPGIGLSGVADHLGTSLPAASELVARLVRQGLLERAVDPASRRRIRLSLTAAGSAELAAVEAATLRWLAERLGRADPERLAAIERALADLAELLLEAPGHARGRSAGD